MNKIAQMNMRRPVINCNYSFEKQKGIALFVSLIFLLVLTIIAVSSMSNTILDTKVVINQQDKSFSAMMADAAIREPEVKLHSEQIRLALEHDLCNSTGSRCSVSSLWNESVLDWDEDSVASWWGVPSEDDWAGLPIVYGTNGTATYCAGKPNEKVYDVVPPQSIDDSNDFNDCLANVSMPLTYVVESTSNSGSSATRSLEAAIGQDSTCDLKKNNYFWQTTMLSSGVRDSTRTFIRGTYVKKC